MSDSNQEQLRPPPSWDKFEEICADLFSKIWDDPEVVRYGTGGQAQNGIDIYGRHDGAHVGVQCKGRRDWPPTKLSITDIDEEVEKAKAFIPALKSYIIVTTAENDVHTTDRANLISVENESRGLFRVTVYGWTELVRRLNTYPDLLKKHFATFTVRGLEEKIDDKTNLIIEKLGQIVIGPAAGEQAPPQGEPFNDKLADALERDFSSRYDRALKRSLYPELDKSDEFSALAVEIMAAPRGSPSQSLRRLILFRASRAASLKGQTDEALRLLEAGQAQSGGTSELPARARLAAAEGRPDQAIQLLRDETNRDARGLLLGIIATARGDKEALHWFDESDLAVADVSASGLHALAIIHLRLGDYDAVNGILDQTTAEHFAESPYLYFMRGAMRFARLLPKPEQAAALAGLPLEVFSAMPVVPDPELSSRLDELINDLRQALTLASGLDLRVAPRVIESFILWCELLHPSRREAASIRLRREMADPSLALRRIQYALAYDQEYSPNELEIYLDRRDSFGGLSDDELRAKLVILLHRNDAAGIASLISAKRQQFENLLGDDAVGLEIQALAKNGDAASAKIVLEDNLSLFDQNEIASFRAEIAKAEGADPVAEHLQLYEATKTAGALRGLVSALYAKKDHIGVAKYAELLFTETEDPRDVALAARSALRAGDGDTFVRLVEDNQGLQGRDADMLRSYGWQLFRLGRFRETKVVVDDIESRFPAERDLSLEFALAIDSGEWEELAAPLSEALDPDRQLDGIALIRAAHLAQASGQGPMMDLLNAAVARGGDDPHVLLGAYQLLVERGLEEERPEAQQWFQKALALSGPDGPVQAFELKDILSKQVEWNEHSTKVNENLIRGELPLVVASAGLRTTVVDIILRNLVRNPTLDDGRRRVGVPLFAGRNAPLPIGNVNTVALDITALLVLGWLEILPTVLETFPKVIVPAGALIELFDARKRIRQTQRTRLSKAIEVRDAISTGRIKVLRTPSVARDPLSAEIGVELASLLREADKTKGFVVHPAPIRKVGFEEHADADVSAHAAHLCDLHQLLKALADLNALDEETENSAKQYFEFQDSGWSWSATPERSSPIYLDGLAVVYLQYTDLLQTVLRVFSSVYVHLSTQEEANVLIEHDQQAGEVLRIIDDVRNSVRRFHLNGKVVFGPRRAETDAESEGLQSTLNLMTDLSEVEVVVFDDRGLNKEPFVADSGGHRARICSTLDLLEELTERGIIPAERYRRLRFLLRGAGAMLIPVSVDEILAAAARNRQNESPEFRAIRDSIQLARRTEIPQFPGEIRWFLSYVQSVKSAIARVWINETNVDRARLLASQILDLDPNPEDWIGMWHDHPPPGWVSAVRSALIGGLAMPIEIDDRSKVEAYQHWLEEILMSDVRTLSSEIHQRVVNYLREFILNPWLDDAQ
jgi:hypothetical protein